jgi:hypothetical protein
MDSKDRKARPEETKHTWSGSQGAWANAWSDPSRDDARDSRHPSPVETMEDITDSSGDDNYK